MHICDYTHDQLNTTATSISFLRIFLRGGGGAKFNFAPGRQLPSLRHCYILKCYLQFKHTSHLVWTRTIMEISSTPIAFCVILGIIIITV